MVKVRLGEGPNTVNTTQKEIDYIKENWLKTTNKQLGEALNMHPKRVSKLAMGLGLPKKTTKYLDYLGIKIGNRVFKNITQEQIDYIKENFELGPAKIGREIGIDPRRVSDVILELDLRDSLEKILPNTEEFTKQLKDLSLTNKFLASEYGVTTSAIATHRRKLSIKVNNIKLPRTDEVDKELKNPYLSHAELGRKYNVNPNTVARRRKELGVGVRIKNYDTIPELQVKDILNELDLVYTQSKRIGKYSIDLYLGQKICIDVHGEWVHNKPKVQKRDKAKTVYLSDNGFHYLVIHEQELTDTTRVKSKIISFLKGFPYQ